LAIFGIFQALSGQGNRWWLLVGLAWGLGVLSKGPVIFVHTLPLLLFARYWLPSTTAVNWRTVMTGSVIALLIAAVIIFAWVIPAAARGGEEYAQSILFGQNVQRALKAPNDALAWWYYIAFMPFILFPWAYWGGNWKALKSNASSTNGVDHGRRFCVAWMLPVLLLFTFISGKKVHYLLPVLPAVALYLSSLLAIKEDQGSSREMWPLTTIYIVIAVIIGSLPFLYSPDDPPYWVHKISIYAVIPFLALAIAGQLLVRGGQLNRVRMISLQTVILLVIAHFTIFIPASQGYDLRSIALEIARLQEQELSIAHNGKYRGEYHLFGHLKKPFDIIYDHTEQEWINRHPDGYIISYRYELCGKQQEPVEYQRLFRNGQCVTIRTSAQQKAFLQNRNK
jgi:4-amino-4-deoxy-L-arabinose transferase-like glycosyltransferase